MNEKTKNTLSILLAVILIWLLLFSVFYWIFNQGLRESIQVAGAAAIAGWLAPILVKKIRKEKN
jgi:hypothetical protein